MSKSSQAKLSIGLSILAVLGLGLAIFRTRKAGGLSIRAMKPANAIRKVFQGTEYEGLIPYIIAQAKHETGNFTSEVYHANNNMFGMGRPSSRATTDNRSRDINGLPLITEGQPMANYDSLEDSAKDLMLWFKMFRRNPFPGNVPSAWDYSRELRDRGYFTDSIENYSKALSRWM